MFLIRRRDQGPRVVALQVLINRFMGATRLEVDGMYGPLTETAVANVQRYPAFAEAGVRIAEAGVADPSTCRLLAESAHLQVVSANDIYDPRHDDVCPPFLRNRNLIRTGGMSGGVPDLITQVRRRVPGPARLLSFVLYGHGAPGLMGVSGGTGSLRDSDGEVIEQAPAPGARPVQVRPDHNLVQTALTAQTLQSNLQAFIRLRPLFCGFGWMELHGCRVGSGRRGGELLHGLAEALQVPVSAGLGRQSFGQQTASRFEGPVRSAYPGPFRHLAEWAEHVRSVSEAA